MTTYAFRLHLDESAECLDATADALYEAGCDDGTLYASQNRVAVAFDREAASLESAIASALRDVRLAGHRASRIEIDAKDFAGESDAL